MLKKIGIPGWIVAVASSLVLVAALACGGEEEAPPTPQPTTAPAAGVTPQPAATTAPTPAPAAAEVPASKSPAGTIIMAELSQSLSGAAGSLPDLQMFPARQWGVGESLFTPSDVDWGAGMLAESWDLAPDNSEVTINLRRGVLFHKDWGEFKAEDMAWVINRTNPTLNPESIASSAANFSALFGDTPIEVTGEYQIKATFNTFDVRWASNLLNQEASGGLTSIATPKRAFDEMGRDWMRDNFIGTGPLQVVEHKVDIGGTYERVPYNHWLKNAGIQRLQVIAVPEESTRVALLETGEADVAFIDPKDFARMNNMGFVPVSAGNGVQEGVMFPGNLWESVNALTGQPIDFAQHGVFARELPWIGNPWTPDDANNPPGIDDMEQARMVRQALARAVDRDAIIEFVLGGVGNPVHVDYFSTKSPYWDPQYEYPYDVAEANRLLDQAGYPRGGNGVRFEMPLFVGPELGGGEGPAGEIGDAIAGFWQEVGVNVPVLKYAYAVFRPGLVSRSTVTPMLTSCDDGQEAFPWDWPKGLVMTTLTRGGFSCGFESPEILAWYQQSSQEPDTNKRIEINTEVLDYLHNWALFPGYVSIPNAWFTNPKRIQSWDMHLGNSINSPENIVLVGQ